MSQEIILIASAILGVILVPSFITARRTYPDQEDLQMDASLLGNQLGNQLGSQPTE